MEYIATAMPTSITLYFTNGYEYATTKSDSQEFGIHKFLLSISQESVNISHMAAQKTYERLFQSAPTLLVSADLEGKLLDVSDDLLELIGYDRKELIAQSMMDFIDAPSIKRWEEEFRPLLERLDRFSNFPVSFRTNSGQTLGFLMDGVATSDQEGRVDGAVCVLSKASEFDNLVLYRRLYRRTPAMLHTFDSDLRIEAVSNRWLSVLGYEREEVIGRSLNDFLAPETAISSLKGREVPEFEEIYDRPRVMLKKNGERVEVLSSAWIETNAAGEPVRAHGALKDVTLRNEIERQKDTAFEEINRLKEELEAECNYLREEVRFVANFGEIIGDSPAMHQVMARIDAVASTPATVLITGESGVGKELVARAIHRRSDRADKSLVKVNCASIPHDLFESEFFGHVKGAFTGAHKDRTGRFQLADGGLIFLDEVGEIPIDLQAKLLRVLQEQEFERVGEDKTRKVNVRIIAATNRNLAEAVDANEFREDLYYRLNTFPIDVPPLRKRQQDVVPLAQHFLRQAAKKMGREVQQLSRRQADNLEAYCWPGNVRELQSVIDRAVILSPTHRLQLELALPQSALAAGELEKQSGSEDHQEDFLTYAELEEFERKNLIAALNLCNWRISGESGAAQLLGVKPSTLSYRMKAMGIQKSA